MSEIRLASWGRRAWLYHQEILMLWQKPGEKCWILAQRADVEWVWQPGNVSKTISAYRILWIATKIILKNSRTVCGMRDPANASNRQRAVQLSWVLFLMLCP